MRCLGTQLTAGLAAGLAILAGAALQMQAQSPQAPAFEVASVRRHVVEPGKSVYRMVKSGFGGAISGNRVTEQMVTLTDLLTDAYDVKEYQISGAPDWAARGGTEYFDIAAKAEGEETPPTDQVRRMLQSLLADRFQLKLHRETKELPVYDLVVAKGGPKLREPGDPRSNKLLQTLPPGVMMLRTTVPLLIQLIAPQADRPVIDQTGLTGTYEYAWPQHIADVSIFTVVEEQLGLNLKPDKALVEMLVIDHAAEPSEN